MKKLALFLACLLIFKQIGETYEETHEVANSSGTIHVISVSSGTAINMDTSTTEQSTIAVRMGGRFAVEIYNDDDTDNLFCGFSSTGSVTTTARSRRIAPRSGWVVQVGTGITIFCISDGSGSVSTAYTQLR